MKIGMPAKAKSLCAKGLYRRFDFAMTMTFAGDDMGKKNAKDDATAAGNISWKGFFTK